MTESTEKIEWIITQAGLDEIIGCMSDSSKSIYLPYIRFGNGVWGDDKPTVETTSLKQIADYYDSTDNKRYECKFNVNKKSISKADENTVIFSTEVNETQGDFTISEIGLYGIKGDNEEYLFAIGTCEPFYKPSISDNYDMFLSYDVCIKYNNLKNIYGQIKIDELTDYATEEDLNNVIQDTLYIESNLAQQIANNTRIIGLNRVSQLYDLINESTESYSSIFLNFNYTSLLNFVNIKDILAYWVFTYSGSNVLRNYIPDMGDKLNFLELSQPSISFPKEYVGLAPVFNFLNDDSQNGKEYYYKLDTTQSINFCNSSSDLPFTIFLSVSNNTDDEFVYLCKSDSYNSYTLWNETEGIVAGKVFEIGKTNNNALRTRFYTDNDNYMEFHTANNVVRTNEFNVICIRYNGVRGISGAKVDFFINGRKLTPTSPIPSGNYVGMNYDNSKLLPLTSYIVNSVGNKTSMMNAKISEEIIIQRDLLDEEIRVISYNLMSILGLNVCYRISSC